MARVKLQDVRKSFGDDVAVHDASFEVHDGEFMVLVGPSGCGKSTTLRMIAGLESISSGTLTIGEQVMNDLPPSERDIAMVFQNYALYPHMTVSENLAFSLVLRKLPKVEIAKRVKHAAELLGLDAVLDRRPRQLSGGQRQRVAIGRAIVRQPQAFLFDEPLSNLDAKMRVQTRREISALQRRLGVTTVYVTHDQVEAMTMGDRIVVMNKGRIQQVDTPLGLYERPANLFVAGFIGSPAMNMFEATVVAAETATGEESAVTLRASDAGITLPLTGQQARALAPFAGQRITAGVRPESLYVEGSLRPPGEYASMRLPVVAVESLGNETLVYARAGDRELTARVGTNGIPRAGETVELLMDLSRMHFFERDGGGRIGGGASSVER